MANEYPVNVVTFARRLHKENGYRIFEIRGALAKRGYFPTHNTILRWVDPAWAQLRNDDHKLYLRRIRGSDGTGRERATLTTFRRRRLHKLRELGLSYADIAKVMNLDFDGLTLNREQVRYLLTSDPETKTVRKHLLRGEALA